MLKSVLCPASMLCYTIADFSGWLISVCLICSLHLVSILHSFHIKWRNIVWKIVSHSKAVTWIYKQHCPASMQPSAFPPYLLCCHRHYQLIQTLYHIADCRSAQFPLKLSLQHHRIYCFTNMFWQWTYSTPHSMPLCVVHAVYSAMNYWYSQLQWYHFLVFPLNTSQWHTFQTVVHFYRYPVLLGRSTQGRQKW